MNRTEHVETVKQHALAALDEGNILTALTTVVDELPRHPETQEHAGIDLLALLAVSGMMHTEPQVREFVEGIR